MARKPEKQNGAPRMRCAIYTRKSTEEGLDQDFNSLDAQRESAEAYIASQRNEGWTCVPDRYDDGGFTGGNMDRPALKRLMGDIEAGKVDCVVVYKVDRLSRSLMDFARIMEVFDRKRVSFVSVTQQFNTSHSMGRLTLHILLSFAQFEREIISERTRDKIAAARRKGKWSGGRTILGYDVDPATRKLIVNEGEAEVVRRIFRMYLDQRSLLAVSRTLNSEGVRTKLVTPRKGEPYGGRQWDKAGVLKLLTNPLFVGLVRYKDECFKGEHAAIVEAGVFEEVQELLQSNGRSGGMHVRNKHGALLKGLVRCKPCGVMMGHTYAVKNGDRVYRYYVCYKAQKQGWESCPCQSLPAEQIEQFVVAQLGRISTDPELLAATHAELCRRAQAAHKDIDSEVVVLDRTLHRLRRELDSAATRSATDRCAPALLADLHERIAAAEARRAELADARSSLGAPPTITELRATFAQFTTVWARLSLSEQCEYIRLLVKQVDYDATTGTVAMTFHSLGLRSLDYPQLKEAV